MPLTMRQHDASLHQPAFCELLPVRDYLDNVIVRSNGSFVAGYELGGINSYYHSDDARNQTKLSLEALVRSLPERSMRMQVRFEVVDQGPGVPAEYRQAIFEKYFQLPDAPPGGAGLGLFIAREIVHAHGGEIGVEDAPGGGSIFWFTVPRA